MPTTNPRDMSRNVRSRAWTFSKSGRAARSRGHARQGRAEGRRRPCRGSRCRTGRGPAPGRSASARREMSIVSRRDAQVVHQVERVGPRPLRRAEAGHRQAVDRPAVDAEHVARLDRDQQRERRVEPARDADVQRRARRELLDPLGQPRALDAEDLGAAAVQLGPLRRDERRPGDRRASGPSISAARANGDAAERRAGTSGSRRSWSSTRRSVWSLSTSTSRVIAVRVAADRPAVADPGRLRQQPAVLGDQAVAAEDQVGRRLASARAPA